MPVVPGLTTIVPTGRPYYRITPTAYGRVPKVQHRKVVDGEGAVKSRTGSRYNHPGARTVYLAENAATAIAERTYYFHREVLLDLDQSHVTNAFPPFGKRSLVWEIFFKNEIPHVFELSVQNASAMNVFPCLMLNPSQDYTHLKDRRAAIENQGYRGLRAPSSRVRGPGHMIVLFADQSRNLARITPFEIELRLITSDVPPRPFTNQATDSLDYQAGEVRVLPPPSGIALPPDLIPYQSWSRVEFNH